MEPYQGESQPSAVENQGSFDNSIIMQGSDIEDSFEVVHKKDINEIGQNEPQPLCDTTNYNIPYTIKGGRISLQQWFPWVFETLYYYATSLLYRKSFTVGILTYSEKDECKWLNRLLRSDGIKDHVADVQVICYSGDIEGLKDKLAKCSYIIFYHRGKFGSEMTDTMIASIVRERAFKFERKNMMIALGHLKNKAHEDRMKQKLQEKIGKECNQLLFTSGEIERYKNVSYLYPWKKLDQISVTLSSCRGYEGYSSSTTKHTVGIVSRSAESDYEWLDRQLKDTCQADVRHIYISNNGWLKVIDEVSHCTFAILYHTIKRGRINITDISGSLYDEELKYLDSVLGKDNVIVVVDDLENSSIEEKERILQNQPSIEQHAKHLILFTKEETDPNYKRLVTQQEEEDERNLQQKIDDLRNILEEAKATMMSGAADTIDDHKPKDPSNTPALVVTTTN